MLGECQANDHWGSSTFSDRKIAETLPDLLDDVKTV